MRRAAGGKGGIRRRWVGGRRSRAGRWRERQPRSRRTMGRAIKREGAESRRQPLIGNGAGEMTSRQRLLFQQISDEQGGVAQSELTKRTPARGRTVVWSRQRRPACVARRSSPAATWPGVAPGPAPAASALQPARPTVVSKAFVARMSVSAQSTRRPRMGPPKPFVARSGSGVRGCGVRFVRGGGFTSVAFLRNGSMSTLSRYTTRSHSHVLDAREKYEHIVLYRGLL